MIDNPKESFIDRVAQANTRLRHRRMGFMITGATIMIGSLIAIIMLYDWKLALLIMLYVGGNNISNTKPEL